MIRFFRFSLLIILFGACNESDHFGYDRLTGTIHYRLLSLGDENLKVNQAEHVSLKIELVESDSHLVIKDYRRINWKQSRFPKYFENLFVDACHGDSISLIGSRADLQLNAIFGLDSLEETNDEVELHIHVYEALSDEGLRELKAKERLKIDLELKEKATLRRVLDSLDMNEESYVDGIYFKSLTVSEGEVPGKGDYITVQYSARLGNGKLVDDNFEQTGLSYEIGKPDQVIPGFGIGMNYLTLGSEAYFIIPSHLGFGSQGSSSGIVPPYSILVYRVKLVDIAV